MTVLLSREHNRPDLIEHNGAFDLYQQTSRATVNKPAIPGLAATATPNPILSPTHHSLVDDCLGAKVGIHPAPATAHAPRRRLRSWPPGAAVRAPNGESRGGSSRRRLLCGRSMRACGLEVLVKRPRFGGFVSSKPHRVMVRLLQFEAV